MNKINILGMILLILPVIVVFIVKIYKILSEGCVKEFVYSLGITILVALWCVLVGYLVSYK